MIAASRKDGTIVRKGDRVLARWDNGTKTYGNVIDITGVQCFSTRGFVRLQTYLVKCDDGKERPANAWHIIFAMPPRRKKFRRRAR